MKKSEDKANIDAFLGTPDVRFSQHIEKEGGSVVLVEDYDEPNQMSKDNSMKSIHKDNSMTLMKKD